MPKYLVLLREVVVYEVVVEAESEDDAAEAAEHAFVDAEDATRFPCEVLERDAEDIQRTRRALT
jgi:hypothetical protein